MVNFLSRPGAVNRKRRKKKTAPGKTRILKHLPDQPGIVLSLEKLNAGLADVILVLTELSLAGFVLSSTVSCQRLCCFFFSIDHPLILFFISFLLDGRGRRNVKSYYLPRPQPAEYFLTTTFRLWTSLKRKIIVFPLPAKKKRDKEMVDWPARDLIGLH